MKVIIIIAIITFFYLGGYSQTSILMSPISLDTIKVYENSIKSISKGFQFFNPYYDEDFEDIYKDWPQVIKKPLIFKRTNDDFFPTLHTWYFYDKDSTAKWIIYHWGFANTEVEVSDSVINNQTLRLKDFEQKYKIEKKHLIYLLGKPTKEDCLTETVSYINRKSVWDSSDKRVVLNMTVDKKVVEIYSDIVREAIVIPRSKIEIKILMKE